jgi:hypothetical protein
MPSRYFKNPDIIDRLEADGEYYLFNPITARFKRLNRVASDVWTALDDKHEVAELADHLLTRYQGAGREKVIADVDKLLQSLADANLAEVRTT